MQTSSLASILPLTSFLSFFFNDTATTEIYTLSLHDALPISRTRCARRSPTRSATSNAARSSCCAAGRRATTRRRSSSDRKSTRLNSSHPSISYAVFCLKKKKKNEIQNNVYHRFATIYDAQTR